MEEALHEHCASCFNLRCAAKLRAGSSSTSSCDVGPCPLACGASFHACKSGEHRLLCPLERVACLNSAFGCPVRLARHRMAPHLEVCPAGLVCCTMEWNRWPVSGLDYTSRLGHCNSVGGGAGVSGVEPEQLDMALALQDQRTLLKSLNAVAMMTAAAGPARPATRVGRADVRPESVGRSSVSSSSFSGGHSPGPSLSPGLAPPPDSTFPSDSAPPPTPDSTFPSDSAPPPPPDSTFPSDSAPPPTPDSTFPSDSAPPPPPDYTFPSDSAPPPPPDYTFPSDSAPPPPPDSRERIANGIDGLSEECYGRLYEATLETARSLAAALHAFRAGDGGGPRGDGRGALTNGLDVVGDDAVKEIVRACRLVTQQPGGPSPHPDQNPTDPNAASPGLALRPDHMTTPGDAGLWLVDSEEQGAEPPPRKPQGFRHVPGPVASAATHPPRRGPLTSPPWLVDRALDTSDLEHGGGCGDPGGLVSEALLYCLEETRESRRISDPVQRVDGRRADAGTQTFTFPAAILVTDTRVGDTASASACDHATPWLSRPGPPRIFRLGPAPGPEVVEAEARQGPQAGDRHTFSFVCGQAFRRDQFCWHSANVHADIHAGLSGWMERRCPLAFYGCTFSQRRLCPGGGRVVHDGRLQAFGVQTCPGSGGPPPPPSDRLSAMPMEVLWHVAGFLDSYSLCQLAAASRGLREVCAGLLQTRGVVDLQWERRLGPPPCRAVSWSVKHKVWRFSTAFGAVPTWRFSELPSMADHLQRCPFNTPAPRSQPVPLPAMCTMRDRQSLRHLLRPVNK